MRVLYYLDSVNRGGAEILMLDLCKNAARFGIEAYIAAGEGDLRDDFSRSGVPFFPVRRKLPIDAALVSDLRDIVKRERIAIVHASQPVEGLHLFLATHSLDVRRFLTFQGFLPDRKNRWASRFLIPRMDANIVVSRGLAEWLGKYTGLNLDEALKVVHNGADPSRLLPTGRDLKAELGIPPEALVIGMIGNFYRDLRKDQLTLAKAFSRIAAAVPSVYCLFVGKTEEGAENKVQECKSLIDDSGLSEFVRFTGPRSDIPDVLAALDVFVLSSFHEGLPIALTEAMLAGIPAVVSDIAPHREATAGGIYARLFRTADPADLAEKTIEILLDAPQRSQLSAKAKQFALDNFSIDAHLRSLKRIYKETMAK